MRPKIFLLLPFLALCRVQGEEAPRWTVIHAPALKKALMPLADHRVSQGYEVEWVEVKGADSATLLETLAGLRASPPRSGDVVVLAGALDAKGGARKDCVLPGGKGTHGRMKDQPSDGVLAGGEDSAALMIGRLPAESPEDMSTMVAKILRYEKESSKSQGKLGCVVGNPMGQKAEWLPDAFVALNTKLMLFKVNSGWTTTGADDLLVSPFAEASPEFGMAMDRVASGTWETLAYFGHSGPEGIYSLGRSYRLSDSWFTSEGPARGLFFTCGCHALETQDAYAVRAMRSPSGPAAVIGASGVSYSTIGYLAGKGLIECVSKTESPQTAGEWWGKVRHAITRTSMSGLTFMVFDRVDGSNGKVSLADQRQEHLEMWSMLGDPAMRMRKPPVAAP
ncbi:C25 family cysteine peptidase [Luteolibacter sp. GHJ8]|uniref:C25 family cysteine peptidase n=1 Tax=Luteolibacter rhizosphaerae TaxID=2989719 RepID=A0ABT3G182_9BACT|nr:C25 family cysteine peptidase [Luteolibacter rhizosphaerae]MCW1913578.1 C25 family cysteine peptidase [Luteolibacter rhizosphaerae]